MSEGGGGGGLGVRAGRQEENLYLVGQVRQTEEKEIERGLHSCQVISPLAASLHVSL